MTAEQQTPGERIRAELAARGWIQDDLAKILGRQRTTIVDLIQGRKELTADLAIGLASAFEGSTAEEWMALESARKLRAARDSSAEVDRRRRLFELAPVKDMQRRGWISKSSDHTAVEAEVCAFFGINSIDEEPSFAAATRRPNTATLTMQQRAWLFRAKRIAEAISVTAPFNSRVGSTLTKKLRELAAFPIESRFVPRLLAENGIRFLVVEGLPGGSIDGATFWLDDHSPVIAMSMRYDRADWFWFTLCHECSHVLNGDASIDDGLVGSGELGGGTEAMEQRANAEAAAMLIEPSELDSFIRRVGPLYSKPRIIQFANRIRIHPGIVVGQLQHRKEIKPTYHREMLVKIREYVVNSSITDGWGHSPGLL
ncbi:MAG: addiction module antidote protein, HigA family [Planctomycetota bacterium]